MFCAGLGNRDMRVDKPTDVRESTLPTHVRSASGRSRMVADTETDHGNILSKNLRARLGIRPRASQLYF